MSQSESNHKNVLVEQSTELQQQEFERLNLKELGLQPEDFAQVMDAHQTLTDMTHSSVSEYGKDIATKTSTYTDELLNLVQNKDLDTTGQKLNEVVQVAQQLNTSSILNKSKGSSIPILGGLLNKIKGAKQSFDQHFNTTKEQIDALVKEIEQSQNGLKSRVNTLDKMFDAVQDEYKQLGVHVAAGKIKQQEIQQQIAELNQLEQDQQMTQQIYDLNHLANNLEKRVSDLQVLQQSAMQTLPMIRIIQSNNLMLVDKFYAIKNITLPAWKNQISLAISLQEQKNSVQLAKNIDDATNDLLRRNADLLHQNSVDTAKANQRSVIDIETLEHVQNTLIKTVNDVIQVQKEGMQKRDEAATRLRTLQQNLNQLVIESSHNAASKQ
ncbi:MAG TPA: toxic anion resistance protein [Acinetobacter ursingii]|uniref:toxic anion resistance protein n=1 Tax=Acinetobacter ursingii TaxID=108980 RepID=UPI000EDDA4BF|nr:toxic anion resistance protein [Acinetobacter ursingii]MCH2004254.1 toxic anion resistance protein [Acinetobacter ursingii]MCU4607998.1 toxic anion resistance protein [Acinetobacter ursingii]MDU4395480.1 toxic anion resistance protein [Acinetobacter ursingii]HCO09025.1 toxic anion resistance protein [Acinetobacter ursingii]